MSADAPSENEQQLRFVANAVPALLAYVDVEARYRWCNDSYRRCFGHAPDELRGRHMSDVLGAAACAQIRPYVERALAGEEVTFETRVEYKHGRTRKPNEEELREADRRKDEFLAMLSHELRNPMAPILSAIEIIEQTAPDQNAVRSGYQAVTRGRCST